MVRRDQEVCRTRQSVWVATLPVRQVHEDLLREGVRERSMSDREQMVRELVNGLVEGSVSADEAIDLLLNEMGRGGRILMVDETSYGLGDALIDKNFTVVKVQSGKSDEEIKDSIWGRVLITRNGEHFSDSEEMEKYHYGVVWVTSSGVDEEVAKLVVQGMQNAGFKKNIVQVVKV